MIDYKNLPPEDEDHIHEYVSRQEMEDRILTIDYLYRLGQAKDTNTERMISKWAYEIESLSYRFILMHMRNIEQAEVDAEMEAKKAEANAYSEALADAKNNMLIKAHRDRHSYANNTKERNEKYRQAYSKWQLAKKEYWRYEKMMDKCTSLSIKMAANKIK